MHLVLTDIKMPGMNGRELGRLIEERWPGKPILYMSGFASEVFRGGLLEPGAPFLAKPFTQDDLAARCGACWRRTARAPAATSGNPHHCSVLRNLIKIPVRAAGPRAVVHLSSGGRRLGRHRGSSRVLHRLGIRGA